MRPSVGSIDLEALLHPARYVQNACVISRVYVRQRNKDSVETAVARGMRNRAGRIRHVARQAIRSAVLKFVLRSVESVTREQTIHIDRSYELSAAASLVSKAYRQVMHRLQFCLEGENVNVRIGLLLQRSIDIHRGDCRASRISA